MLLEETCDICSADTILPVITLNGAASISLNVGETYTEHGAIAIDNTDGDISAKIITTGSVNTSVAGTYTITYTVSDVAGNVSTVTRIVTVVEAQTTPSVPEEPVTPPVSEETVTNTVQ